MRKSEQCFFNADASAIVNSITQTKGLLLNIRKITLMGEGFYKENAVKIF